MGTRNLTAVYLDGEYKIAQYGQWDGYPEGQGLVALQFLRDKMNLERFKVALRRCSYINQQEYELLWRSLGIDCNGVITLDQANFMEKAHPQFSRNTGADILALVQSHSYGIKLRDDLKFAADGLCCEWAWVIDLDAGTFGGYKGFNTTPLTDKDRFYFLRKYEEGDYHGVRLVAEWNFDNLPSDDEFLTAFK